MNEIQVGIKDLIDIGSTGILLVILWRVWNRLSLVTDVLIELKQNVKPKTELTVDEHVSNRAGSP